MIIRFLTFSSKSPYFTGICSNCGYDYGNLKVLDVENHTTNIKSSFINLEDRITPHKFRHSHATQAIKSGMEKLRITLLKTLLNI